MIWQIISDMCSGDKTTVTNQTAPERLAENTIRQNPGNLKTISHRNPAEKPFEIGASAWELYPVLQHVWHYFSSKGYKTHDKRVLQTTASLIDQGCRTLKSSGRTWLFLVRYLLYGLTGVGLNPTKIHYHMSCQRWRGIWFFCYISLSLSHLFSFSYIECGM